MNYIEIPPPNDISSYIKCIWKYHNDKDSVHNSEYCHPVFPAQLAFLNYNF